VHNCRSSHSRTLAEQHRRSSPSRTPSRPIGLHNRRSSHSRSPAERIRRSSHPCTPRTARSRHSRECRRSRGVRIPRDRRYSVQYGGQSPARHAARMVIRPRVCSSERR
jgi:hypothetical protein